MLDLLFLSGLAILPSLVLILFLYGLSYKAPPPVSLMLIACLFGVISTYPAIKMEEFGIYDLGMLLQGDLWTSFTFSFLIVAFSEETLKYIFLRYYLYPKKEFAVPLDGIVYAACIGLGFAAAENFLYLVIRLEDLEQAYSLAYRRMFTALPAHAAFGVVMGYFMGLARFQAKKEVLFLLLALLLPIVLHGLYDFFIFQKLSKVLTIFTEITLAISLLLGAFMIRAHRHYKRRAEKGPPPFIEL